MSAVPEKHSPYFNLKDAFKEKHCPICYLLRKSVTRYFDSLLYEHVNSPDVRTALRKSKGFCQRHFWQLVEFGDGLGISILEKDILATIQKELAEGFKKWGKEVKDKSKCPACKVVDETEINYLGLFLENLSDFSFVLDYERSFGFCLIHFGKVYLKAEDKTQRNKILEIEIKKVDSLVKELDEFIRKHDYQFSKEEFGKEGDAWIWAVEFLKGRTDLLDEKRK